MDRMYSVIEAKSFDDEQRVIEGWATTPSADRVGDVVEPFGVQAAKDIPLYLYHDSEKVVGRAQLGAPTAKGVPFRAEIPKLTEPGALKDRVDEAWQMVKHGLITAVSIGFRALDGQVERIKEGGLRFKAVEVLELSLVPVPANSQALITAIKSADAALLASSGKKEQPSFVVIPPGVSGTPARKSGVVYF